MKQNITIENVSDTSFWVAYYRAKETERKNALFRDPLAKVLVGDRGKKISDSMAEISRYTEWSVISRTLIIDRLIEKLIKDGVDAVINLGAGLDTRPYRMNLPRHLSWVEVDHANIIEHKNHVLKNERPQCHLTRVALDLSNSEERKMFLSQAMHQSKKVLILTEGVIPYLSPEQVELLAKDLLEQTHFKYWITEYFHEKVYPYLKTALRTEKMKNAPFLFFPLDWYGFFRRLGWVEKETRFTGEIALEFKRKPPMPRLAQLLFFLIPKKVKEESLRMTGYVVFERAQ